MSRDCKTYKLIQISGNGLNIAPWYDEPNIPGICAVDTAVPVLAVPTRSRALESYIPPLFPDIPEALCIVIILATFR